MKKKKYEKPSIEVVVINKQPQLLAGSGISYQAVGGLGYSSDDVITPFGPNFETLE